MAERVALPDMRYEPKVVELRPCFNCGHMVMADPMTAGRFVHLVFDFEFNFCEEKEEVDG